MLNSKNVYWLSSKVKIKSDELGYDEAFSIALFSIFCFKFNFEFRNLWMKGCFFYESQKTARQNLHFIPYFIYLFCSTPKKTLVNEFSEQKRGFRKYDFFRCFGMWKQVKLVIILCISCGSGYTHPSISIHCAASIVAMAMHMKRMRQLHSLND